MSVVDRDSHTCVLTQSLGMQVLQRDLVQGDRFRSAYGRRSDRLRDELCVHAFRVEVH